MGDRESPIFVIGNPRSGTTLLRLLIASHPNICIPPECGFALWLKKTYAQWSGQNLHDPESVESFTEDLVACRKFDTWEISHNTIKKAIEEKQPTNFVALVGVVYRSFLEKNKPQASRWGDKNNFHVSHVAEINSMFPDCKFVHVVRDVRDVACSYRELKSLKSNSPYRPNLPFEVEDICNEWKSNVQEVLAALEPLESGRSITVRYEDIVQEPASTSESICDLLGEEYVPEMLNFYLKDLEPKQTMDWKKKTRTPVSTTSLERFRRDLPAAGIATANELCHDLLSQFGYPSVE